MLRSIVTEYDKLAETLANQVGLLGFRFKNLCVKAEPASLLQIEVPIMGELKKLEECCQLGKLDDVTFALYPQYDEDLPIVSKAVMAKHPEFKQEVKVEQMTITNPDGEETEVDVKHLLLTMPEVNDDRYDALKDAVEAVYQDCKFSMETADARYKASMAKLSAGESEKNLEILDRELKRLNNQWDEQRERLREAKLDEIEDAHNVWETEQAIEQMRLEEERAARGEGIERSMRFSDNDE